MESFPDAPLPMEQVEEIVRSCGRIIPSRVLLEVTGLKSKNLSNLKKRLGIHLNFKQSRKLGKDFLDRLPDLSETSLTIAQRQQVAMLRQLWIYSRVGDLNKLDRQNELVHRLTPLLPTSAIAAVIQASRAKVTKIRKDLGVEISRSEQTKLMHAFAKSKKFNPPSFLSKKERWRLKIAWREAREKRKSMEDRRAKKSNKIVQDLLEDLKQRRSRLLQDQVSLTCSQCSGVCGQSWPRTQDFFVASVYSKDKLGQKCKYCTFLKRLESKNRERLGSKRCGRVLSGEDRQRVVSIVAAYSELIPSEILCKLFKISRTSLDNLRVEAGVKIQSKSRNSIYWRWYFNPNFEHLELLSDLEVAELALQSKLWRNEIERRFSRDLENEKFLKQERLRILQSAWHGPESVRPAERECRTCGNSYPSMLAFFKADKEYLSYICRVCANYETAQWRLRQLKRRYGL